MAIEGTEWIDHVREKGEVIHLGTISRGEGRAFHYEIVAEYHVVSASEEDHRLIQLRDSDDGDLNSDMTVEEWETLALSIMDYCLRWRLQNA